MKPPEVRPQHPSLVLCSPGHVPRQPGSWGRSQLCPPVKGLICISGQGLQPPVELRRGNRSHPLVGDN